MTKLEAINTMLLYINETPITATGTGLHIEILSDNILAENIRIVNQTLGLSITDSTLSSYPLLEDYIVKRSSRNLFTRVIGFEEKGLDVIINDEKQSLGNVIKYILTTTLSSDYDYYRQYLLSSIAEVSSVEQIYMAITELKSKIDSYNIKTLYPYIDSNLVGEYILYSLTNDEKKYTTIKAIISQILINSTDLDTNIKEIALSIVSNKTIINDIDDYKAILSSIETIYENTRVEVLSYGFNINTISKDFMPDALGYISIPSTVISIDVEEDSNIIMYDHKLFDKENLSYKFDNAVTCTVKLDIPMDDIPEPYKGFIVAKTKVDSLISNSCSQTAIDNAKQQLIQSKANMLREDANSIDANVLDNEYVINLVR